MEALTPTQFQLMVVAWDLADRQHGFTAWDATHATGERYGYRGHPAILRLLTMLVDRGYLDHDPDADQRSAVYTIAVDRTRGARLFVDGLLDQLGDDPRLLELAEAAIRERLAAALPPAAAAV